MTPEQQKTEEDEAIRRFAAVFSHCPKNPHGDWHSFWLDKGYCIHCRAPYPYASDEPR
jgi:hypothetical protein